MSIRERDTEASGGYAGIDSWSDARILETLVVGQERAIAAVRNALPQISRAAAATVERLARGGRLTYAGAGSSIHIGVQDGCGLPATFGMPEDRLIYLIAGGRAAMFETLANAEDDEVEGVRQAEACRPGDVLLAIAASGSTPFTLATARRAK